MRSSPRLAAPLLHAAEEIVGGHVEDCPCTLCEAYVDYHMAAWGARDATRTRVLRVMDQIERRLADQRR